MVHNDRRIDPKRLMLLLGRWSDGSGPLYALLGSGLGAIIDGGLLDHGDRLPPERRLAAALSVARGTVVRAYDELQASEHVDRRRGSGTYVVCRPITGERRPSNRTTAMISPAQALDLRVARPALLPSVRAIIDRPLLGNASHQQLASVDPAGLPALRAAVAELMTSDGLITTPEEILITSGAQHGATLLTMHLLKASGHIAVEQATWPGFPDTVEHLSGQVHRIPIDHNGIDLTELDRELQRLKISFVAVNPHHHNPTGTRLSDKRRSELTRLTVDAHVPLIEDRVLARLAFDRHVPAPLATTAAANERPDLHITVDSLDKVAWPGLRVGWIRATPPTIQAIRGIRAMTDFEPPTQPQLAALAILDDLDHIVEERTNELRNRCDALFEALPDAIPDAVAEQPRGGISVWIRLPTGTGLDFARHATTVGIQIPSGTDYGAPNDDPHIRLPLTTSTAELDLTIAKLTHAWRTFTPAATHP